jgi:Fibronectin type III domain
MANSTNQHPIKAITNFRLMTPDAVVTAAVNIDGTVYNNPNFTGAPAPPVDQPTLKAATDALIAANAAAVDGGKKAIQQQKHQKEVVVGFLIQLAHWAEANCKADMTTFLSSGFKAAASARPKPAPVSESIRKIVHGTNSGQLVIKLVKSPGAASYEVRWGQAPAGGGQPTAWNSQPVANVRTPVTISGLTPGAAYVIQARAVTKAGYTDYGQPLTQIAI